MDWALPAAALERRLRAYTPWPGLHTFLGGERVKIVGAGVGDSARREPSGTFWTEGGKLLAAAGEGTSLELRALQRAGRKPVSGADFALAARLPGRFGPAKDARGS